MAVILSADLTEIDDCDVVDNWTSNENIGVDTESKREGTGSIGIEKVSQETSYAQYDYYTDHGNTYLDLTGESHIYFWVQTSGTPDTKANGGFRIRLTDAAGNYREWWVGGSDNYYGGFQNYVIYTGRTPDASSGTLNLAQIRYVTIYFKILSKTVVGAYNCWVDILYYGTGLIVKGGTAADKGTFDEIIAADDTPAYGVLAKKYGVFIAQGPITFGDSTGVTDTYFKDESQILLFADAMVSSTHYELKVVGNATGTNSFELGSKVGTSGVSGCVIKSIGAAKFKFTATDTNVNIMKVYGCSFLDASTISLPANATDKEVVSSNFEACAEVIADTCVVKYCKFISADNRGARISSIPNPPSGLNITDCSFIDCTHGVNVSVDGTVTITFDNLRFSGNDYDVEKSSPTGDLTIQNTNGSDAGEDSYDITGGGTVTIETAVTLTVRHVKTGTEPTEYVRCYIEKKSDKSEIMNMDATVVDDLFSGYYKATMSYNQAGFTVIVRAREKGYLPFETEATITSDGLDVTAVWIVDPNYQP